MIRKEAWPFYRTSSGVRLCWELEEPKGPKGPASTLGGPFNEERLNLPALEGSATDASPGKFQLTNAGQVRWLARTFHESLLRLAFTRKNSDLSAGVGGSLEVEFIWQPEYHTITFVL